MNILGTALDALIVVVIVLSIVISYKKGLISMLRPLKFYAAVMAGWHFRRAEFVRTGIVSKLIDREGFRASISERVSGAYAEKIDTAAAATNIENEATRFDGIFGWLESLFSELKQFCIDTFAEKGAELTENVIDYVTDRLIDFIGNIIGFLVVFAVAMILLSVLSLILQCLFSIGEMKTLNGLLGSVIGIVIGFIVAWLLAVVIVKCGGLIKPDAPETVYGGVLGTVRWFFFKCPFSALFGIK